MDDEHIAEFENEFVFKSITSNFDKIEIQSPEILNILGRSLPEKSIPEEIKAENKSSIVFKPSINKKENLNKVEKPINTQKTPDLIFGEVEAPHTVDYSRGNEKSKVESKLDIYFKDHPNELNQDVNNEIPPANLKLKKKKNNITSKEPIDFNSFDIHKHKQNVTLNNHKEGDNKNQTKYDAFNSLDNNFI